MMSSPIPIMTLISDVLVLGAAVSIVGIVLGYFLTQYKQYLPASIEATFDGTQSHVREDDVMV